MLGQGQGVGLTNRLHGSTGGREAVTLATANLPAHNHPVSDPGHQHTYSDYYFAAVGGYYPYSNSYSGGYSAAQTRTANTGYTGITTVDTGSGTAFATMPPFYVLAYIMKI